MKVLCRHGHIAFYPRNEEDIGRFSRYYKKQLVPVDDYYTFPFLKDAPRSSLKGAEYMGLTATANFEGRHANEVMKANGFVYSIALDRLVTLESITTLLELPQSTNYYLGTTVLIQPGSRTIIGDQILSYDAEFIQKTFNLKIRSFSYE